MTANAQPYQVAFFLSDPHISAKLTQMIKAHFSQLEIVECCHTSNDALKVASDPFFPPRRILFIDDTILFQMPDFLHRLDSIGAHSDCILLLQEADFKKLQGAIRCGVADCLLASFSCDDLKGALDRIINQIQHRDRSVPAEAVEASRYLFWRNDIRRLSTTRMSIAQVNKEYGIRFSEGLFRALFIELSCRDDPWRIVDNQQMQDQIIKMVNQLLKVDCFDILYNRHSNGVSALLNYSVTKRSRVTDLIDRLFFDTKKKFWDEKQVDITMSIGRIYSDFIKLPEAKQEILDARWARKHLGAGRIINAEDIHSGQLDVNTKRQLRIDQDMILHYVELLDVERATHYIETFFCSYRNILSGGQMRLFFREILDFLFHNYSNELQCYGNPDMLRHSYINREVTAQDIEKYIQVIIANCQDIMHKIEAIVRKQYSQPIKDCITYISMHHCKNINLPDMAEFVHLTPQYLSSRFHKETGMTISEYINEQKMSLAKSMLIHSDKNISEIADFVGFTDARYFSRFFKGRQHTTPSEYRRIKQAAAKPDR